MTAQLSGRLFTMLKISALFHMPQQTSLLLDLENNLDVEDPNVAQQIETCEIAILLQHKCFSPSLSKMAWTIPKTAGVE